MLLQTDAGYAAYVAASAIRSVPLRTCEAAVTAGQVRHDHLGPTVNDPAPTVVDDVDASRFEILVDGDVAGFAEYRRDAGRLELTHTVIDPTSEGQGLGSVLILAALDAARGEGLSVLPFCPLVREVMQRHPEYVELVPPEQRQRFKLGPSGRRR